MIWKVFATSLMFLLDLAYSSAQRNVIEDIICDDIKHMNNIFDENVFYYAYVNNCPPDLKIVTIDTLRLSFINYRGLEKHVWNSILKVGVQWDWPLHNNSQVINGDSLKNHTFYYYIFCPGVSSYYRLFGFYTSNINSYLQMPGEGGVPGLKALSSELVRLGVLKKQESKYFLRSVLNRKTTFDKRINKPCIILSFYYTSKEIHRASTQILPYELMKPQLH